MPAVSGIRSTTSSPNAPDYPSTPEPTDATGTSATTLLLMGVPARVVMQILGHSQIGLTLGTYSHVVPELATDAANKLAAAYWS